MDKKFIKGRNGHKRDNVVVDASGNLYYANGRVWNRTTGKMESYTPDAIEGGWDSYWGNTSTQSTATQNSKAAASATGSGAATGNETP